MHKIFLRIFFFIAAIFFTVWVKAQNSLQNEKPQMADGMRADGKIYVVIAVLLLILSGLFIYVIRLDKKISRLEKHSR